MHDGRGGIGYAVGGMTNVPDFSERPTAEGGLWTQRWYAWFKTVDRTIKSLSTDASGLSSGKASVSQPFAEALIIEIPQDKAYVFVNLALEGTITEVVTQTASGTCTVTVDIDGLELGGPANSASTTKETQLHSERNTIRDGSTVTVTVSSNSSATDLSITLRGTRTLA